MTFQGRDVDESRYMYDQLAVLAPIMLAMTAATPIFKGSDQRSSITTTLSTTDSTLIQPSTNPPLTHLALT